MKAVAIASILALGLSLGAGCKKKDAEEALRKVSEAAKAVGKSIAETAKAAGKKIAAGAKKAWEATKKGAKFVGEKVAAGAKKAWEATKKGAKFVGEKVKKGFQALAKATGDAWITTKIKTKIGMGKLLSVGVTTSKGTVTLTGKVATAAEKGRIEKLAKGTKGVKNVVSKLVVGK